MIFENIQLGTNEKEPRIDLGISLISFVWERTTNWSRNFLNQFCLRKNHGLISEFLESVLFEKEPRIDLGISLISFVWKRTTNWSRNFLNQFCLRRKHTTRTECKTKLAPEGTALHVWNNGYIKYGKSFLNGSKKTNLFIFLQTNFFGKKTMNWTRNFSNSFLGKKTNCTRNFLKTVFLENPEMILEFPQTMRRNTKWTRSF